MKILKAIHLLMICHSEMILRKYQEDISIQAAELLQQYKICYLSMAVRTGKTLTAFAAAEKYGAKIVLFVTKKKAISSIDDDYNGLDHQFVIDIINYEQLHNIIRTDYDFIILDESHCCSQYPIPAERTKLLKKICKGLPIIFLSGTPSAESYSQLYHQFWISSFSPFKEWVSFYKWANAGFVDIKKKYYFNKAINDYSHANKEKIDNLAGHLFISFTQESAGFTEEIIETVVQVTMMPATYNLVKKLITKRIHIGNGGEEILADTNVKLMQKTHQIFSGSVLTEDGNGIVFDYTKAKYIKEKYCNDKIAIFYVFRAEYAMLVYIFGFDKLTGDPQEFNERNDKIFVSQIQSGSMGTNLSTADYLIMLNIHYSNVHYWQAKARIQDKNRTKPAHVVWLFAEHGIEFKIYEAVKNKQDYVLSYFKKDFGIKKIYAQ